MNPFYQAVADRARHRCEYCRAPEAVYNFPFEVEHILPPSRGGDDSLDNLALACRSCNVFKGNQIESFDEMSEATSRLFNPRTDEWNNHFNVDLIQGKVIGLSPIGRATVACLQMNSAAQQLARKQWMLLDLFP